MKLAIKIFKRIGSLAVFMFLLIGLRMRRSSVRLPIPPFKLLVINQTWPDKPRINHCRADGRRKIGYLKTYKTAST